MLKPLLTAHWNYLTCANFIVEPNLLGPYVPDGTELDYFGNETYLSVVGFLFYHTAFVDLPLPRQRNFEHIDLRFYVRKRSADTWRRGIVFLRALTPRAAVPIMAQAFPTAPYQSLPTRSQVEVDADGVSARYEWRHGTKWEQLFSDAGGVPQSISSGSHEEFITDRAWLYAPRSYLPTAEYRVEHPRWKIFPTKQLSFKADVARLSSEKFVPTFAAWPRSVFIVEGSFVTILARSD